MINLFHPYVGALGLILLKIICLLVSIAYFTLAERKILAAIQRRRGPNVVGVWGLLQPAADGLKLIAKEMIIPSHANSRIFVVAPVAVLTISLLTWSIIPFGIYDHSEFAPAKNLLHAIRLTTVSSAPFTINVQAAIFISSWVCWFCLPGLNIYQTLSRSLLAKRTPCKLLFPAPLLLTVLYSDYHLGVEANNVGDSQYGLLIVLALSSLSVYGLILSGWSSNSKYAFLGALRSAAQMISYEVAISLVLLPIIAFAGSLNFARIVFAQVVSTWFLIPLLQPSVIFFISMIAETNRTPFDLPEAEAELVAGYNIEYSSIIFAMFFLAEYGNMSMMALLNSLLFLGGGGHQVIERIPQASVLTLKGLIFCFLFVLVRAAFPRYRYDQLMNIGWKIFLPVSTGYLVYAVGILITFDAAPTIQELALTNYSE